MDDLPFVIESSYIRRGKTLKLFLEYSYRVCNTAFLNTKKKMKEVQLLIGLSVIWHENDMRYHWLKQMGLTKCRKAAKL
jgi:hypothetical protein